MIFKRRRDKAKSGPSGGRERLEALVREHLPDAPEQDARLVVAVTGLLASVAYADREYSEDEREHVRESLERVHGLSPEGVQAICIALDTDILELAAINTQAFTRDLRELTDLEVRREVLDVLVDLAAADGEVSMSETELLRRTTTAMGLTQDDYNNAQAKHKARLSVLK
ncbi:MAG: TerB family tellurite resistance protein [Myxococcales bacterium]|jgi:uncharacterized tellurite resistance protein B-like protein